MDGGKYPYKDASGYNLDNQALVFKVQLPKGVNPAGVSGPPGPPAPPAFPSPPKGKGL